MAQVRQRLTARGAVRFDVRIRIDGAQVSQTFDTEAAAAEWLHTIERDKLRGNALNPRDGRMTFAALVEQWQESNPHKRPSTLAGEATALRRHIVPALGRMQIAKVRPADVQHAVNSWAHTLSARSVDHHYRITRAVFSHAVANDWLDRSPCRGVKLPKPGPARRHRLDPAAVEAIAAAMDPDDAALVWLAAVTGMRWAELAGLRVGRLDLLAGSLTVVETLTRGEGGRRHVGPPKSDAGARTIPLDDGLVELLAAHLARRGLTAVDADAFVFGDDEGGPLDYSNWRRRVWLPATRAAGHEGAGLHDLRRMNASVLAAAGVDVKTMQSRLGHADVRMTLDVYAEATREAERAAARALGVAILPPANTRASNAVSNGPRRRRAASR